MEYKAHRPCVDSVNGHMSRIEQDLSASPHNTVPSEPNGHQPRMLRRILSPGRVPHVCVVGAGVAGLRCADFLIEHGFKVTILEGRNRIGGRVRLYQHARVGSAYLHRFIKATTSATSSTCKFLESLSGGDWLIRHRGPNWIHGTNHNPILDLAVETKTITYSIGDRQSVFDSAGRVMDEEKAATYSELVWGIIADAFKHSNEDSAHIPPEKSLMDFFREKVKEKDVSEDEQTILLQMAQMWGAFVGDPIEKQSLKFFWLEECIEGGALSDPSQPSFQVRLTSFREPLRRQHVQSDSRPRRGNGPRPRRHPLLQHSNLNQVSRVSHERHKPQNGTAHQLRLHPNIRRSSRHRSIRLAQTQ